MLVRTRGDCAGEHFPKFFLNGYWPTAGGGLTLNLAPGTAFCGATPVTYSGGTLTMAASATNYVFLNPAAACAPEVNTTGFAVGHIPIATVVTSDSAISTISDLRTWFSPLPCTVGSTGATTCAALGSNQDLLLTPSGTGNVLLPRLNNIRYADRFPGANAGEKIAAAIAELPSSGGVVDARGFEGTQTINGLTISKRVTLLLGNATFNVSAKIRLESVAGVRIEGQVGSAPGYGAQTTFYWTGNDTDPMFELDDVAYSVFKHFTVKANSSYPLKYAFQMFNGSGTSVVPTGRVFEDIWIQGTDGSIEAGFKYSIGAGGDVGNDFDTFYRVVGANYSDALWRIDAGQSKFHRMYSCLASGNRIGKAAVKTDTTNGGSFEWYGGGGGGHTEADFWIGAPNDAIKIDSGNWEGSTRFLIMPAYATASVPVVVESNRWAANYLHADGKAVYDEGRGPLVLIGNRFIHNDTAPALQIWCYDWSGTQPTANHIAIANVIVSSLSNPFTGGEWTLIGNSVTSTPGYPLGTVLPNSLELELVSPSVKNSASDPTTLYLRHYADPDNKYIRFYDDGSNAHMTRTGGGFFYFEGADRYIFAPRTVFQGEFQEFQPYGASDPKPSGELRLSATDSSGNGRTFYLYSTADDGITAKSALASLPTFTFKRLSSQSGDLTRWLSEDGSTVLARMTAGGALATRLNVVTFSSTPTFDASLGNTQKITLSGNVTSSTLTNALAGQTIQFLICQDGIGGRSFAWPSNVKGAMVIGSAANTCNAQAFIFDGTNAFAVSSGVTEM